MQTIPVASCAGVSCTYLQSFFICSLHVSELRCVLFVFCMHSPKWVLSVLGAVLPVRSQVFIRLDSRRQITRPKAATHPSSHGLPKWAFNMHYSFLVLLHLYKPDFPAAFHWFPSYTLWECVSGKQGCGVEHGVACIFFRATTLFSLNQLCSLMPHQMTLSTVNDKFPVVRCLLPQVGFAGVCLHICACLSACGHVWSVWMDVALWG